MVKDKVRHNGLSPWSRSMYDTTECSYDQGQGEILENVTIVKVNMGHHRTGQGKALDNVTMVKVKVRHYIM